MALREHLAELRRRLTRSAIAIILGTIVGWVLSDDALKHLIIDPVNEGAIHGHRIDLNNATIGSAFNIRVTVAVYIGLIGASPVWIYQLWAFVTPGLTTKERRYSLWFVAFAVPLFLAGVVVAILIFPKAVNFGNAFAMPTTSSVVPLDSVVTFAARLLIALGVAFLAPLFLVGMNLMGFLSGRALGRQWRIAVFISFLFAAIVSPSPSPEQMIALAVPLTVLYAISVFICLFNDHRRARKADADPVYGLSPDEASPLN